MITNCKGCIASGYGPLILAAVLLTGCMVGPDFKEPQPPMPASWIGPTTAPTTQQSIATTQPTDVARWWTVFNDPVLNSLIDRAIESNLNLKQAIVRIRQARASRAITSAALWPNVNTSGSYKRAGSDSGSHDLYQAGLDASWEIDVFGGTRRSVEAADASIQSAIEDRRDTLVTLTSEVAINYFQLRGSQRAIEISQENLEVQRHSASITRQKFGGGLVGSLDIANSDAQLASTESQIPVQEASVRQTIYALSVLLGRQPAELLQELSPVRPIPTVPAHVPVGLPSELLRRRPDIRRAEAQLHADTASIGSAEADLFPKFSLTGSFSAQGKSLGGSQTLFNWQNSLWSIGPTVSWPLFDAGRIRANIALQKTFQEESFLAYQQTVLTALQDVESSLVAYEKEQQHREFLVVAVNANRRALDSATLLYSQGLTDFLNVLDAQRSLYVTESALVQSDQSIATDLVSLYKALGGGWDEASTSDGATTRPSATANML